MAGSGGARRSTLPPPVRSLLAWRPTAEVQAQLSSTLESYTEHHYPDGFLAKELEDTRATGYAIGRESTR